VSTTVRRYPVELEQDLVHRGERFHLRPVRLEDEAMIVDAVARRMTTEDMRLRFFSPIRSISHEMAVRLWDIDYDTQNVFLLFKDGELEAVSRLALLPGGEEAEFALTIASDRHRRGYGQLLLQHLIDHARARGIKRIVAHILRENVGMLALAEKMGFVRSRRVSGGSDLRVEKEL
jgi:acetyltransferase